MLRRSLVGLVLGVTTLLVAALPAHAGGWAVVTLDTAPAQAGAGESLRLGFTVRQHGVTPIDAVRPYLSARRKDSSESIRVNATKEGATGHFVVDVTFPSAGTWSWEITPEPFEGTKLEPLTVAAALTAETEAALSERGEAAGTGNHVINSSTLRWAGVLMLAATAGLIVTLRRGQFGRRLARWRSEGQRTRARRSLRF